MTRADAFKMIQKQLTAHGLYTGAIDGLWGPGGTAGLEAAIRADKIIRLSPNFAIEEFIASDTAERIGDANMPDADDLVRMVNTAEQMEWVRTFFGGRAIIITSGYRNERVNKAVGGVKTSAHTDGNGADFRVAGLSALKVSQMLAAEIDAGRLKVDQLIYEASRSITHISFDHRLRREVLTQAAGPGTPVVTGIRA